MVSMGCMSGLYSLNAYLFKNTFRIFFELHRHLLNFSHKKWNMVQLQMLGNFPVEKEYEKEAENAIIREVAHSQEET